MRLDAGQVKQLKRLALEEAGPEARLRLFGSPLDDARRVMGDSRSLSNVQTTTVAVPENV